MKARAFATNWKIAIKNNVDSREHTSDSSELKLGWQF